MSVIAVCVTYHYKGARDSFGLRSCGFAFERVELSLKPFGRTEACRSLLVVGCADEVFAMFADFQIVSDFFCSSSDYKESVGPVDGSRRKYSMKS